MTRRPEPYTYTTYRLDRDFLAESYGIEVGITNEHTVHRKRELLASRFPVGKRLKVSTAPQDQIHAVFLRAYTAAQQHMSDITSLLEAESTTQRFDETLSERIAIMLDSCSEEQRATLTERFGARALGDYGVAPAVSSYGVF